MFITDLLTCTHTLSPILTYTHTYTHTYMCPHEHGPRQRRYLRYQIIVNWKPFNQEHNTNSNNNNTNNNNNNNNDNNNNNANNNNISIIISDRQKPKGQWMSGSRCQFGNTMDYYPSYPSIKYHGLLLAIPSIIFPFFHRCYEIILIWVHTQSQKHRNTLSYTHTETLRHPLTHSKTLKNTLTHRHTDSHTHSQTHSQTHTQRQRCRCRYRPERCN